MNTAHPGAASVSANTSQSVGAITRNPPDPEGNTVQERMAVARRRASIHEKHKMANQSMLERLPQLDDDKDVGVLKSHFVRRDNKEDLRFTGVLLASAAPQFRGQDRWREYRVYRTNGGNFVFTKVGRSVLKGEFDKFEAFIVEGIVDDREPQLIPQDGPVGLDHLFQKKDRHPAIGGGFTLEPLTDQITSYFGFDPVAKALYSELQIETAKSID
jgi:hypothetical protein